MPVSHVAQWRRPKRFDRNLIVIGAGAAGLVSSYIAATLKAKVTLIEAHKMGGDCLNYGCVPSKALIKSARMAQQVRNAPHYGIKTTEPEIDFDRVMSRVHEVIRAIEPHDSVERYTKLGVDVVMGHARLLDPWTVEIRQVDGAVRQLTSRSIIIASGARAVVPDIPGLENINYVTTENLWNRLTDSDKPPARLTVLGGGPVGCELAQSFARLGIKVTLIERAERLLSTEDSEVSSHAKSVLQHSDVTVLTAHEVINCVREGERQFVTVHGNNIEQRIEQDMLLCAVGRQPRLSGFGLEALGIDTTGTVHSNEYLQILYPNIYAAGDVAGPYQFTHVAAHQAWHAAVNSLFGQWKKFKVDYRVLPRSIFLDPEIARVGLNEQEAKSQNIAYEVTRFDFDDFDRAMIDGLTQGFVKVLTVPNSDRILGVTIVGEHAGDLLAEFTLAMKHGLGLNKILSTVHSYPTFSEANKQVAGVWKRKQVPRKIFTWLERYHTWRRG